MNERPVVIGITGVAGSGKDTAAGILSHRHGFFRIALADGVRSAFRDLDGITWGLTKELEQAGHTGRWALQRLGTEARERVAGAMEEEYDDPDSDRGWIARQHTDRLWCYLTAAKIAYLHGIHPRPRHRFVVPDVSYPHEIATLEAVVRRLGGDYETWRIDRPGAGRVGEAARHGSEVGRATIPAARTIPNHGTIAALSAEVDRHARALLRPPSGHQDSHVA